MKIVYIVKGLFRYEESAILGAFVVKADAEALRDLALESRRWDDVEIQDLVLGQVVDL